MIAYYQQLYPDDGMGYLIRGNAYKGKSDYDRAIADYDQAVRLLDPQSARKAYTNRGEAYEAMNDIVHAIADFDQALRLSPDYASRADARRACERVQVLLAKLSNPGAQTNALAR
jgi:tetratricopeptide (TPR) repeat protein